MDSSRLAALARSRAGNVAIIFALALTALAGCMAAAIDYARGRSAQTVLQQAADSAALAAAKNPDFGDAQATQLANATFTANGNKPLIVNTISSSVMRVGGSDPSVTVSLSTQLPTTFAAIFGYKSMPISASSKASLSLSYNVIYAVIDMSASMGLAADPAARAALNTVTAPFYTGGCMFGCHMRDGWEPAGKTVYQLAKDNGISLREDVLVSAFGKFTDTYLDPSDPAVAAGRRLLGVYGYSDDAQLLIAPSNSASAVKPSLATFPSAMRFNTNFPTSLATVLTQIGSQGNGTPASPRKTILLITDGMSWYRPDAYAPTNGPMDTSICDTIKAAGFTLAVIDVKYQDASGEPAFDTYVAAKYPQVSPALTACASPSLYFQATDSDAASLAAAFASAAGALRSPLALTR